MSVFILFALFIVYGATIPFHFAGDFHVALDRLRHFPLNPFISPETGRRLSIPDVVQNVLLFLPFGALGLLGGRVFRPGVGSVRRVLFVTLLGFVLSAFVESLQLLTTDRVSSLGDVISNTAGTFLGAVLAWQFRSAFMAGLRRLRKEGLADAGELRPFAIATLVLAIAFWQPFDITLELGNVVSKVRMLETDLWQFTALRDEGTSLMLSAFFATTLASYLSVLGERHAGAKAGAIGIGLVFMLEASQLLITSRMPGLWDALVASLGIVIGVAIWSMASRIIWPRLWLGVLVVFTAGAAALQMLSPFVISEHYRTVGWFPFLGYYTHTTFETLSHVIELMLLYFPLGFWAGTTGTTRTTRTTRTTGTTGSMVLALSLALAIAAPVEYLQGWVVGRYPDITDVALSLVGAWIGVRAGLSKSRHFGGQ